MRLSSSSLMVGPTSTRGGLQIALLRRKREAVSPERKKARARTIYTTWPKPPIALPADLPPLQTLLRINTLDSNCSTLRSLDDAEQTRSTHD